VAVALAVGIARAHPIAKYLEQTTIRCIKSLLIVYMKRPKKKMTWTLYNIWSGERDDMYIHAVVVRLSVEMALYVSTLS